MSESCNQDCANCGQDCASRNPESLKKPANAYSNVKKVIAVVSGKGGVGKSSVTSMLAVLAKQNGLRTAILDADITGPSIPQMFGVHERAVGNDAGISPAYTKTGIELMSINLLLPEETDPVVWRGPILAGAVEQFWTDVVWGDIDLMLVDCPPGTGDVPLTVFQSIPVDGIVVVASPQGLVSMIVEKAVKMAEKMNVPVLGLVENMSYFQCPDCGGRHAIFGESNLEEIAQRYGIDTVAKLPIDPSVAEKCDRGQIEDAACEELKEMLERISK